MLKRLEIKLNSLSYFDETVFMHGESLTDFTHVNVFNDADAYLIRRQGIPYGYECSSGKGGNVANLNPRNICSGTNIFTMNPTNRSIRKMVNFNQIYVHNGETNTPLHIGEHKLGGIVYTVSTLTSFESAIMIKYFAINHKDVFITNHLYAYIRKHFNDERSWFNYKPIGIVENYRKELILDGEFVNLPHLEFASDPIEF